MKRLAAFLFILAFEAAIFWLGGYDFDRRGFDVAYIACAAVLIAALATNMDRLP